MLLLFNLLKIKCLYMFRALLARLQEGATQTALGMLRVCYISWHAIYQLPLVQGSLRMSK
jgi:hypothetical protein